MAGINYDGVDMVPELRWSRCNGESKVDAILEEYAILACCSSFTDGRMTTSLLLCMAT